MKEKMAVKRKRPWNFDRDVMGREIKPLHKMTLYANPDDTYVLCDARDGAVLVGTTTLENVVEYFRGLERVRAFKQKNSGPGPQFPRLAQAVAALEAEGITTLADLEAMGPKTAQKLRRRFLGDVGKER